MENDNNLDHIVISLIGGSTSGKTTFFSGIFTEFVAKQKILSMGDYSIGFIPVGIKRGISDTAAPETNSKEEEQEDQLNELINAVPQAFPQAAAFGAVGSASPSVSNKRGDGSEGIRDIDARNATGEKLTAMQMQIMNILHNCWDITNGFYGPTATITHIEYTFCVIINDIPVCYLSITDYAGELVDANTKVPEAMINLLSKHINNSNGTIILANSVEMSRSENLNDDYKPDESIFTSRCATNLAADTIGIIINTIQKRDFSLLLAITQKDSPLVSDRVSENNFRVAATDLKKYVFQNAFLTARHRKWGRGVLPVTAVGTKRNGDLNVDENNNILPDADFRPENIDKAILYILYNAAMTLFEQKLELYKEQNTFTARFLNGVFLSKERKAMLMLLKDQIEKLDMLIQAIFDNTKMFDDIYGTFEEKFPSGDYTRVEGATLKRSVKV